MSERNACCAAALRYAAEYGWRVFPLDGKKPFKGTNGFKDATTDAQQIKRWWKKYPHANVGIACDSQRGPIVLDVDGPTGWELIRSLDLPETREAASRSDRLHMYFGPMLDGTKVPRIIKVKRNGHKYELDILGDGGYVVAPPSIHPDTGKQYQWLRRRAVTALPPSIYHLIRGHQEAKKSAEKLPDQINEGQRDELLTSLAGSMRRRGASEDAILAALREENATRVNPPLKDSQLKKIAASIAKKDPHQPREHLTDMGNARRFIAAFGQNIRSIPSKRRPWLLWEGTRWEPDDSGEVERLAKQTVRALYREAQKEEDPEEREKILKHAAKSESSPRLRALLEVAATEPEILVPAGGFDADPWLFNVENGTLDLRTGKLRPHKREDLITKLAPVEFDPEARAPRWELFLMEIMDGDAELVEFLQRAVGYSMTGDTREQCLFFCYGQGSNGKSTFLEVLRNLFGDYAQQTDFRTLMQQKGDGPRNDLARMKGARLTTASEADIDKGFDGTVLKQLTGGDTIVARKLYEEYQEFKPEHKLWLAANHKPIVREQTVAFWRRIRLIPFLVTFQAKNRDRRLEKRLEKELPGILNWALAGAIRWKKAGLIEPHAVKEATQSYREENDLLGEFFNTRMQAEPETWLSTVEFYRHFGDWWLDTRGPRNPPPSIGSFNRMLSERAELKASKVNGVRGWLGLAPTVELVR